MKRLDKKYRKAEPLGMITYVCYNKYANIYVVEIRRHYGDFYGSKYSSYYVFCLLKTMNGKEFPIIPYSILFSEIL